MMITAFIYGKMPNRSKRGIILFIVIGIIMLVAVLSTIILRIVANQSRLTHHQVSRVQAMYAAKAGMVWALEMLRTGTKVYSVALARNDCPPATPCELSETWPGSVNSVKVIFCPSGDLCPPSKSNCITPSGYAFCINSTADFTYTP
jgi:Tfp pilus assembly protein PilX